MSTRDKNGFWCHFTTFITQQILQEQHVIRTQRDERLRRQVDGPGMKRADGGATLSSSGMMVFPQLRSVVNQLSGPLIPACQRNTSRGFFPCLSKLTTQKKSRATTC